MTCEEIFTELSEHMIKGLMVHEQLANYYDFLGLPGYRDCHEYHFMEESCAYRKLCRYYVNHYNKLIPEVEFSNPDVIPESWYNHERKDVDMSTKKNAVKQGLEKWVDWETKTKKLYCEMYKNMVDNGSIASAKFLESYIEDVDCELKKATSYWLNKESMNYDMSVIVSEQQDMKHKYKDKMHSIGKEL